MLKMIKILKKWFHLTYIDSYKSKRIFNSGLNFILNSYYHLSKQYWKKAFRYCIFPLKVRKFFDGFLSLCLSLSSNLLLVKPIVAWIHPYDHICQLKLELNICGPNAILYLLINFFWRKKKTACGFIRILNFYCRNLKRNDCLMWWIIINRQ